MTVKKLTLTAILLASALIIFIIESYLPPIVPMPGVKLGLANIITLITIYLIGRRDAFMILMLRIILASIYSGGFTGFLYSMAGGVCCFAVMAAMSVILGKTRIWVVSILGAIGHNAGQIAVACIIIGSAHVLWYLPVLVIFAILTGTFTGVIAQLSLGRISAVRLNGQK